MVQRKNKFKNKDLKNKRVSRIQNKVNSSRDGSFIIIGRKGKYLCKWRFTVRFVEGRRKTTGCIVPL